MSRVISTYFGKSRCARRGVFAAGRLCGGGRSRRWNSVWTFGIFLDGVDIYGEDSGSVVSQESG